MKKLTNIIFLIVFLPFLVSIPWGILFLCGMPAWLCPLGVPVTAGLLCFLLRKRIDCPLSQNVCGIWLGVLLVGFTVLMLIGDGAVNGVYVSSFSVALLPFLPVLFCLTLMGDYLMLFLTGFGTYFVLWLLLCVLAGKKKWIAISFCILAPILGINGLLYANQPAFRYGSHGFDYMNGYSSTDFSAYQVGGDDSMLATLPKPASLQIEKDMPVLDGAEACYPLYAAIAKAVYVDIRDIEQGATREELKTRNGKIVTFTNTVRSFERMIFEGNDVDLFFGAMPSESQKMMAREEGVELEMVPIGKEAFVFFVEEENPVSDLTSDALRGIYHGDITNWKEVGGADRAILPFQRPNGSGSQNMMEHFMGSVPLQEPKTYETVSSMEGVIHNVAQYHNEAGALGYSFRYFVQELHAEEKVKLLSVDGIAPTTENIKTDTYPLTAKLYVIYRKDNPNPNVKKLVDFILSPEGQYLVEASGYAPISG